MSQARLSGDYVSEHPTYWTDDLPVCHLSGVGFSTNQIYREDGLRREGHEFDDRSFHFRVDDGVFLYGVFDGHCGGSASNFAALKMPAELLLGQLAGKTSDDEIKEVLRQAFVSVEKGFYEQIDEYLVERCTLQEGGMSGQFPSVNKRLQEIEAEIVGGTGALLALIVNNRLYVANVGCSRTLLCRKDVTGALRVNQLTTDHSLNNESELSRLGQLGLNVEKVRQSGLIRGDVSTRSIGDHQVKNFYKDIEHLSPATSEPLIADPEVIGGIDLDTTCCFMALASEGLYKSLVDALGHDQVNGDIASMIAQQFTLQSTLNGVAQAVVDQVVRIHHDTFMTTSVELRRRLCQTRDDITLVVRSFDYPLPNAVGSPTAVPVKPAVSATPYIAKPIIPLSIMIPASNSSSPPNDNRAFFNATAAPNSRVLYRGIQPAAFSNTGTNDDFEDKGGFPSRGSLNTSVRLPLDDQGRIEPYVDFSDFYREINELTEAQREALDAETEPKPEFETIPEEPSSTPATPVTAN